jgi:lysylphosphatidylglycerol synthetase-like protein (DUF2156 family)
MIAVAPVAQVRRTATAGARSVMALLWRRLPFTMIVVALLLVIAVATGTLWNSVQTRAWYPDIAYGLPGIEAGRWWTLVTGAFFALTPIFYLPVTGGFALLVGFTEWRLGTRRAVVLATLGQLLAVLGAAMLLLVLRRTGWDWAVQAARQTDVGFSAGALVAAAVVSANVRPPWRMRMRAALCVYVGVSILYVGSLADLEHVLAVGVALPLSRRLAGPRCSTVTFRLTRREWRLIAVTGLVVIIASQIMIRISPREGPLGSTKGSAGSLLELAIVLAVVGLLINGLRTGSRKAWRWTVVLSLFYVAQGVLAAIFVAVAELFGGHDAVHRVPLTIAVATPWTAELAVLIAARRAFRVPSRRRRRRTLGTGDPQAATALLERHGGSTLSWMTTWPENAHFFAPGGEAFVAYRRHAGVAIAVGDPVGPPGSAGPTIAAFTDMCDHTGLVPCMFSVTSQAIAVTDGMGWPHVQVAEDTLIDLDGLEFRGRSWQSVRSSMNRAAKEGVTFELVTLAEQSWALVSQVHAVSAEWLADKGMPEMGFTLGGVDEALDPHTRVGLAIGADGVVQGVTSWLPVHCGSSVVQGWTLDLMRRRTNGFRPVVEFMIASSCLAFQATGARFVSLSGAPLARAPDATPPAPLQRLLEVFGSAMEPYYGFRSLHAFKTKFAPRYQPMYLAYRDEADLPRIAIALARAYLPDTSLRSLLRLRRPPDSRLAIP